MDIILYIVIFIMGTLFGSFFTLATYRIPKKEDIIHKHSYCPNCNHKLGILDLFPIFSYIFLRGKCRYCKEKIRPRYLIIEVLSGVLFVLIAYLLNYSIYNLNLIKILDGVFMTLYLCFIILLSAIDKENRKIEKSISIYGIIISIIYMVYLCTMQDVSVYRYIIYIFFYIIILSLDTITLKRYAKSTYLNGLLLTFVTMSIFTGEYIARNTTIITSIAISFYILVKKLQNFRNKSKKTDKPVYKTIPIGFCLGTSNIISMIILLSYYKFFI